MRRERRLEQNCSSCQCPARTVGALNGQRQGADGLVRFRFTESRTLNALQEATFDVQLHEIPQ